MILKLFFRIVFLAAPFVFGISLAGALFKNKSIKFAFPLVLLVGSGIGFFYSALLYFLWTLWVGPRRAIDFYALLEAGGALAMLLVFARNIFPFQPLQVKMPRLPLSTAVTAAGFLIIGLFVTITWINYNGYDSKGGWDAVAIWNLRARFLFSGDSWKQGFVPELAWTNPDYPLLLSSFIARGWALLNSNTPAVAGLVGLFYLLAMIGLIVTAIKQVHGAKIALLGGVSGFLLMAYTYSFKQYADMPLAYYFLAINVIGFLQQNQTKYDRGLFILEGILIGASVWTKNEGWILLFVVPLSYLCLQTWKSAKDLGAIKNIGWFLAGMLPGLSITIAQKMILTGANYLVVSNSLSAILSRILDSNRYLLIFESLKKQFFGLGTGVPLFIFLIFYLLVMGTQKISGSKGIRLLGMRCLFIFLIYMGIYMITPLPLQWQLDTSLLRLLAQILPSLIVFVFALSRDPFQRDEIDSQPAAAPGQLNRPENDKTISVQDA